MALVIGPKEKIKHLTGEKSEVAINSIAARVETIVSATKMAIRLVPFA